jgi:hypothetical protein
MREPNHAKPPSDEGAKGKRVKMPYIWHFPNGIPKGFIPLAKVWRQSLQGLRPYKVGTKPKPRR